MPDSSTWDHQSFVDHAGWIEAHSSVWESHPLHIPPDIMTTIQDRRANVGTGIQTSKRNLSTVLSTRGLDVVTEQRSDGITPSLIVLEETQNHSSTISGVTDIYSINESYDLPNVAMVSAARVPAQASLFDQNRVIILSIIAVSVVLLIVTVAFLVVILRRSRKKNQKKVTPNSTEASTSKGGRRLVKMESQEHTYEEVEIHKKDDVIIVGSFDTRPPSTAINNEGGTIDLMNAGINTNGKGPLCSELNESNDQPTTHLYSTPIMKRKDEIFEETEVDKTTLHRMYSEPCHFTKAKEQGDTAQENVRYSTPAPTYYIVDPSQYQDHEICTKTTFPRGKLKRQREVSNEKYDKLERSFKMTSSSGNGDSRSVNPARLVTTGPYNHLNIDKN